VPGVPDGLAASYTAQFLPHLSFVMVSLRYADMLPKSQRRERPIKRGRNRTTGSFIQDLPITSLFPNRRLTIVNSNRITAAQIMLFTK
jgi:hypothetical protein